MLAVVCVVRELGIRSSRQGSLALEYEWGWELEGIKWGWRL